MWWLFACTVGPAGLKTPLLLKGDGVVAEVRSGSGCSRGEVRVGLWGPRFGTRGHTLANLTAEEDGSFWLHFRVETGLGEAIAALRIQGDGAVLPLGARPGETEIHLSAVTASSVDSAALSESTAVAVAAEQDQWADGAFLIQSDEQTVGEIQFRGDNAPVVTVADAWWKTPRPVEASLAADGAELVLSFDVEPSFQGEGAQLRVNVPMRSAVAPLGDVPVPEERRFSLSPGHLSDDARRTMNQSAVESADAMEKQYVEDMARRLGASAVRPDGACAPWRELEPEWGIMFPGYSIDVRSVGGGCAVGVEPSVVQHGRRFRGEVEP